MYPCCSGACDASAYAAQPPVNTFSDCECEEPSTNGMYCHRWACEDIADTYVATYTCSDPNTADSLASYCSQWSSQIEWAEKFSLSDCACGLKNPSSGASSCDSWICLTKETNYWALDLSWLWFCIVVCVMPQLVVVILLYYDALYPSMGFLTDTLRWRHSFYAYVIFMLVYSSPFVLMGIGRAGLIVMFVCAVQVYILPFVLFLCIHHVIVPRNQDTASLYHKIEMSVSGANTSEH
jgi:hypothetical protein